MENAFESDVEYPRPSLGKVVSVVFDVRIDRRPDAGDNACNEPYAKRKRPGVVYVMDEGATCRFGRIVSSSDGTGRSFR